jgi:hypothetical protein
MLRRVLVSQMPLPLKCAGSQPPLVQDWRGMPLQFSVDHARAPSYFSG